MRDSIFRSVPTAAEAAELKASAVIKRLVPGAPGTRRLQQRYGKELVCVRYRETADGSARLTTVELVVERRPLSTRPTGATPPDTEHFVRIHYRETELRDKVKAAGGRWDGQRKLWRLSAAAVRTLKLQDRIVKPVQ